MKYVKSLFLIVAVALLGACTQIDSGNVGIKSSLGQVSGEVLAPGVYQTVFQSVIEVTTRDVVIQLNDMRPKSKNNITMEDFDLDVYVGLNPAAASQVFLKFQGDVEVLPNGDLILAKNFVTRNARAVAYNVAATFDAGEMHNKRAEIEAEVVKALQKELDKEAGQNVFAVRSANARSILVDKRLEDSIRAAAQVQYQVEQKKNQLALAQAEADRMKVEAEGVARANRIMAESLTGPLVQVKIAEMQRDAVIAAAGKGNTVLVAAPGTAPMINVK